MIVGTETGTMAFQGGEASMGVDVGGVDAISEVAGEVRFQGLQRVGRSWRGVGTEGVRNGVAEVDTVVGAEIEMRMAESRRGRGVSVLSASGWP
jgi:hypothetical protein